MHLHVTEKMHMSLLVMSIYILLATNGKFSISRVGRERRLTTQKNSAIAKIDKQISSSSLNSLYIGNIILLLFIKVCHGNKLDLIISLCSVIVSLCSTLFLHKLLFI